ncbi:MAG: type II secretion system F family protein [Candidatus Aenigmatarchaeota archaeon]
MFEKFAVSLFGRIVEPYLSSFENLKIELKRARMKQSILEYVCQYILFSLLAFLFTLIFSSLLIPFLAPHATYAFTFSIISAIISSSIVFLFGYWYPTMRIGMLKREIERSLPFAAFYMTTIASSGSNPIEIFRLLRMRKGIIGHEAQRIYTNVTALGMDLNTALQRAAMRSPSAAFSELLIGMSSVITAGGNLEEYLKIKTESLMAGYRRMLTDYSKQISLYTEIYTTLVILGSLFFVVLLAIMSPMIGPGVIWLQSFITFFFVPLLSLAFIILLKSISPYET